MKMLNRITALLLTLCLLLPSPMLAAQEKKLDELGAARLLDAALRRGETGITAEVSASFDFELCLEYTRMLYPDYYGLTWSWTSPGHSVSLRADMAEPEKHKLAQKEARRIVAPLLEKGLREEELLRAFHDIVIERCEYDYDTYRNLAIAGPEPFSAYGALLGGKAVCDGYSAAFAMLCAAADIPCIYVGSSELNHSWNAVFTSGGIRFVDVTYDDQKSAAGKPCDDWFLKTRGELLAMRPDWKPARCDALTAVIWPEHYGAARILYRLGLFRGSDKGFELERRPRRDEAAVMLTRFLGLESQAFDLHGADAPFDDVSAFYRPYIALLYQKGLVAGTSASKRTYSPAEPVTAQQYMTFMLRGLGYSDREGDFAWSAALEKAVALGILTPEEAAGVRGRTFDRGVMAYLSLKTLSARTAAGQPLYQVLADKGVINLLLARELL